MTTSLEVLIKERKEQAYNKNILYRTDFIARKLGEQENNYSNGTETTYTFSRGTFVIKTYTHTKPSWELNNPDSENWVGSVQDTTVSQYTSVEYNGKLVFESDDDNEVVSYIPGVWESEFEQLYSRINATCKREVITQKKEEKENKLNASNEKQKVKREFKSKRNTELRKKWGL